MWRKIGRVYKNVRHFFNFHQNFLFFLWKIWQIVFFFLCSLAFGCILFWLECDVWKIDDLFQRPLGPISIILNFSKKILVKAEIPQLSSKKNEKFWWKLKEYKRYLHPMGGFPPGFFRVKCGLRLLKLINLLEFHL